MKRRYLLLKLIRKISLIFAVTIFYIQCETAPTDHTPATDYSGVYCLNMQNLEMTLSQTGDTVNFMLQTDIVLNGTGILSGNTLTLTDTTEDSQYFSAQLTFSADSQSFTGPYALTDVEGTTLSEGILLGFKGGCPEYDITANGVPKFTGTDFTQLEKIEKISKFRSGFGHSFTDGFEECRSMKHYFNPYETYRKNNTVQLYSPVTGTIISVSDDGHGESTGLSNKQVHIRPDDHPEFIFVLFHVDLLSSAITIGKKIQAGETIGYARLYYEDLDEYATSFDIAVWVNTPSGLRLISYFETMADSVFQSYILRGISSRNELIITQEMRDANPLECNGESFINPDNPDNWITLQ